jgi:hypothetical protein
VHRLLAPTSSQHPKRRNFSVTQIAEFPASICVQVVYGHALFIPTSEFLRHRVGNQQVDSLVAYAAENTHSTLCGSANARPAVRGSTWTCA